MADRAVRVLTTLLALSACGDEDTSEPDATTAPPRAGDASLDAANDAEMDVERMCGPAAQYRADRVRSAEPSPDGQGYCCQPGYPTCDCGYFGAFVKTRCECGMQNAPGRGWCDLAPPDWILGTDEHGCRVYHAGPPTACCNCWPSDGGRGLDCSPLETSYRFSFEGEARESYTVSTSGAVLRGDPGDAGSYACVGALAACGSTALDITDVRSAFAGGSEEWWDGPVLTHDKAPYDRVLVVERADGKKLRIGSACSSSGDSCSAALSILHSLYEQLRTEIPFDCN